jgi:hypothetical protein
MEASDVVTGTLTIPAYPPTPFKYFLAAGRPFLGANPSCIYLLMLSSPGKEQFPQTQDAALYSHPIVAWWKS